MEQPQATPLEAPVNSTVTCTTMSSTPPVEQLSNFHGTAAPSHSVEDDGKQPHPFRSPSFTWMDSIPNHLRKRLEWAPVDLPEGTTPIILLLYAGKDDAGSLDSCIHAYHPELSPMICALDIRRDTGKFGQDLLSDMPYNRLAMYYGHERPDNPGWGRSQLPNVEHLEMVPQARCTQASQRQD